MIFLGRPSFQNIWKMKIWFFVHLLTHRNIKKNPAAACQVFVSTGILKQESKFMNEINK